MPANNSGIGRLCQEAEAAGAFHNIDPDLCTTYSAFDDVGPSLSFVFRRLCANLTGGAVQPQLRQCSVTGPLKGCSPVPFSLACFKAKYHFAGLSASSISISPGLNRSPSACSTIVCWSCFTNRAPKNVAMGVTNGT